jgi:CBS domain containing-hemolysin-like protein
MLTLIYVLAVFLLVFANGFFVAAEFALVGVRRSRIETLAVAGDRRAARLVGLLDDLNAYISATQLGITMASLALGWVGEPVFARLLEGPLSGRISEAALHTIAFAVAFVIITFLHIVLGELAPKTLALELTERVALAVSWPLLAFYKVFRWPISLLDWAGTRAVRLLGLRATGGHASAYTGEELRRLVDISHASGHLEAEEQRLINRVFEFADAELREAMVPRTNVSAIPASSTLEETKAAFRALGYSRLPVYRGRLDDVVGVVFRRDIEPFLEGAGAGEFDLEKLARPPLFIPATARLGSALRRMQSARTHIACVVDEHGGLEGIVTLEDLLEEIVGEINDEYDEEAREQIVEEPNGTYLLDGMLAVRDANRRFNLKLPEEAGYTTMAGFLLAMSGRILRPGEEVEHAGAVFRVERVERRRIRRVRLSLPPPAADAREGGVPPSVLAWLPLAGALLGITSQA